MNYLQLTFIYFLLLLGCQAFPGGEFFDELWDNVKKVDKTEAKAQSSSKDGTIFVKNEPHENEMEKTIKKEKMESGNDQKMENYVKINVKKESEELIKVKVEPIEETHQIKEEPILFGEGTTNLPSAESEKQSDKRGSAENDSTDDDNADDDNDDYDYEYDDDKQSYEGNSENSDYEMSNGSEEDEHNDDIMPNDALRNRQKYGKKRANFGRELSDEEKIKIVKKFMLIRERIDNGNFSKKITAEQIVNKLGVTMHQIKHWKFKYGLSKKPKNLTDEQRKKILIKFDKMKEERTRKKNLKPSTVIESEIAEELGVKVRAIYEWRKKFGIKGKKNKFYTKEEKLRILKEFEKKKSECNRKSESSTYEKEREIAKELGVERSTIIRWRKAFGKSKWQNYTNEEKAKIIKKYQKMIKMNPGLSRDKIAAQLNVTKRTINRWINESEQN